MGVTVNARLQSKRDTTANWNTVRGMIPLAGEIIIYTDYKIISKKINGVTVTVNVPAIKIGDGQSFVQDLPFINESNDTVQFITTTEGLVGELNHLYINTNSQTALIWNGTNFEELESSSINNLKYRMTQAENNIADLQQEVIHSTDKHYVHKQSTASSEWTIVHNLGKFPSITVVDSAGTVVVGEIILQTTEQAVISFNGAFSGKAYCN